MFPWFWQWNKFENRSIFDEIKVYKTKDVSFLDYPVYTPVKIHRSENNLGITIFRVPHFNSPFGSDRVYHYTSNMAAWFYARVTDVTAPYVHAVQ